MDWPSEQDFPPEDPQHLFEQLITARELLGPLSAARYEVVDKLERIDGNKLGPVLHERCSICYNTFDAIIAEEEMLKAMDTPISERDLGVAKLQKCGHYFCRKDISKWILEGNDLCPYCRAPYLPADAATENTTNGEERNREAREVPTSLEAMLEHLQSRWEAAHGPGARQESRPFNGNSGMYS